MKKDHLPEAKSLYDLYKQLGLEAQWGPERTGFTIFNLKKVGFTLPYQSTPFRPNFYSLLFIKDGVGQYKIDDQRFSVSPNTIFFTNPSNFRTFAWQKIDEVYLITFDEAFLKQYVSRDIFEAYPFLLTEIVSPKKADKAFYQSVESLYLQMEEEYLSASESRNQIIGHLLGALLYKIKDYFWIDYNPINEGNRHSQIVKSFKRMLEKNFRELVNDKADQVLRVKDYASMMGFHPNYLSNVIKSKTGKPIAAWITDKTIATAKSLLQIQGLSIKEIAYKLGFTELAHFSNYFKKHTMLSPVQYRKQLAG